MMTVRGCLVSFFLVYFVAVNAEYFKFEDCSKEDKIAEVSKFELKPDAVRLNKNMTIDSALKILRDIPEEAVVKTNYYKIKSIFGVNVDIPIPCFFGFGSCTLPLCEYLDMFKDQVETFFPPDKEVGCPVTAGDYGKDNAEVEIPYIPLPAKIIVGGKYRTEMKLLDKRGGKELACFKIWVELYWS